MKLTLQLVVVVLNAATSRAWVTCVKTRLGKKQRASLIRMGSESSA